MPAAMDPVLIAIIVRNLSVPVMGQKPESVSILPGSEKLLPFATHFKICPCPRAGSAPYNGHQSVSCVRFERRISVDQSEVLQMTKAQAGKVMVEHIVRRQLFEVQRDPKRSIRNLVDLGMEASGGRLQKRMMRVFQAMLNHEDSPYYDLILNTIRHADHDWITTFGVNFGWNGLTAGAARIRELEAQRNHNIPWSLTLHMAEEPRSMTGGEYRRLVQDGTELGIYVYFLMPEDIPSVRAALDLADADRECAFILFLPPDFDVKGQMAALTLHHNVMLTASTEAPDWPEKVRALRENGCLYSLYRHYAAAADEKDIVSGRWMERIRPWTGAAAFLLPSGGGAAGLPPAVSRCALDSRLEQRYPTIMVDFYSDVIYMDVLLSEDSCFLGILPDGSVTENRENREIPTGDSVRSAPLAQLLRRFPKTAAAYCDGVWNGKS